MSVDDAPSRAWLLPDEPVPVRLMSTIWADAEGIHDDLRTPRDIDAWLDAVGVDRAGTRATAAEFTQATDCGTPSASSRPSSPRTPARPLRPSPAHSRR